MSGEIVGILISIFGLMFTIGGVVFALGKRDARLDSLESRCREEWDRNSKQHEDFYKTSDEVIQMSTSFKDFMRRLDELSGDVKEILRRTDRRGPDAV